MQSAVSKRRNFPHKAALLIRSCRQFIEEEANTQPSSSAFKARGFLIRRPCMRPGFNAMLFASRTRGSSRVRPRQVASKLLQHVTATRRQRLVLQTLPTVVQHEVKVNGGWISVPQTKIIRQSAPDGGYHVCAPYNFKGQPEELYCVVLAPEG
jgi:hypothetical protein